MARTNEYKMDGGSYENLSEALTSIDQLLADVKRAHEEHVEVPEKKRGFRNVIAELQAELDGCIAELRAGFAELSLDPLYISTSEKITKVAYIRHIRFLHPEYRHVWLTDGNGENVGENLLPFIDFGVKYDRASEQLIVTALTMNPKLNLPGLKTSLEAAHVDLEILKQDAQRVETVNESGTAAKQRLTELLKAYCDAHTIEFVLEEDTVPFWEAEAERAARKEGEKVEARQAAEAAKRKAEEERAVREAEAAAEASRRKAEQERAAQRRKAEQERAAQQQKAEQERAARKRAEEAALAAEAKAAEEARLKLQESVRNSIPPLPSAPPPPPRSSFPPIPSPPPVKLRG